MPVVKCLYCGQEFDTAKEEFEKPRFNRYAHKICCTEDNVAYLKDSIRKYAKQVLGDTYNAGKVNQQMKRLESKLFLTPKQIYQALTYWYGVRNEPSDRAKGGIGIVENIWHEAEEYYKNKEEKIQIRSQINIEDFIEEDAAPIQVKWEPPTKPMNYKIIPLE